MKVIEGDYVRFILDDSLVVEGIVVNVHDKNNIGVKVMDCSYKPSIGKIFRVNIKRTKNFKKLKYELT